MKLLPPFPAAGVSLSLVPFTLNFTIISLRYTEDMGHPGSDLFNSVERTLNRLVREPLQRVPSSACFCPSQPLGPSTYLPVVHPQLKPLFQNSSIGRLYYGCSLILLR